MARSLSQLIDTIDRIHSKGCGFRSITEAIDATTASGRLTFHIIGALAEFERNIIRERTIAGLRAAAATRSQRWATESFQQRQLENCRSLIARWTAHSEGCCQSKSGFPPPRLYKYFPHPREAV